MEYISSDTNVWIDFNTIDELDLPFKLNVTYIMYEEAIDNELLQPSWFKDKLIKLGLVGVDITVEEFFYADELGVIYPRLSTYDRIALSIAKNRDLFLMTGDNALRKAALNEKVNIIGTIGVLDRLLMEEKISNTKYKECLSKLLLKNGKEIRLPTNEILKRLK